MGCTGAIAMYRCGREIFLFLAYSPRDSEGLLAGKRIRTCTESLRTLRKKYCRIAQCVEVNDDEPDSTRYYYDAGGTVVAEPRTSLCVNV